MKYDFYINQANVKPHLDIENAILKTNGLLSFNLRVNQGIIQDYATFQTVTAADYQGLEITIIEKLTVTSYAGSGGVQDGVRSDVSQRASDKREG